MKELEGACNKTEDTLQKTLGSLKEKHMSIVLS